MEPLRNGEIKVNYFKMSSSLKRWGRHKSQFLTKARPSLFFLSPTSAYILTPRPRRHMRKSYLHSKWRPFSPALPRDTREPRRFPWSLQMKKGLLTSNLSFCYWYQHCKNLQKSVNTQSSCVVDICEPLLSFLSPRTPFSEPWHPKLTTGSASLRSLSLSLS